MILDSNKPQDSSCPPMFLGNDDIYRELRQELERERQRAGDGLRTDPKHVVLDRVVQELAIGRIFWAAWNALKTDKEKHALITRLESAESYIRTMKKDNSFADKWHEQLVDTFSRRLYGIDEEGNINYRRKRELESQLFKR